MRAAGALLVLLIAQQQQLVTLPGSGRVATAVPDAFHGAWFACVTWFVLLLVAVRFRPAVTVALTAVIGLTIAIGTELMQKLTGGDAEVGDVFFDMVGMTAALCVWSARRKLVPRRAGFCVAALLLLGSLWPVVPPLLIDRYRDSIAPELVRFDSPHVWDLVGSDSMVEVAPAPDGWSIAGSVLKVRLSSKSPAVRLDDPISDWRAYSALDVDAFIEGSTPMPVMISVRIDDAPVDHVYREFRCAPGPCRLQLPLEGLFDRDVARVNAVVIYSTRGQAGRVIYLGRVALHA
jgi:hypothetical protein